MHPRALGLLLSAAVVLTAQENGTIPQTEFFCSGMIHGYIRLPKQEAGKHLLEGLWTLPNGKIIQHSRNAVDFPPPGRSTAYVWLKFPERSTLSLNPSADQERLSYNGEWKLDVRWDEKPLLQSTFSVTCQ
jgi:hypothetical protein